MKSILTLLNRPLIVLIVLFILGLVLRLALPEYRTIWTYDQARDSYVIRSIINERNIILLGPQTEFFGLSHGPLFYYYLAPWYYLSKGNQQLPTIAMAVLNMTTIVPLFFLCKRIFKNTLIPILITLFFTLSYEQLEYARWLSNVSVAIPFFITTVYSIHRYIFDSKPKLSWIILAGVFLGLTIQGEIFFLYLLAFLTVLLLTLRTKILSILSFWMGTAIGIAPLIIAEVKFNFHATNIFITQFVGKQAKDTLLAQKSFETYIEHIGTTVSHAGLGITYPMGLWIAIALIMTVVFLRKKDQQHHLFYILFFLIAQSFLFTFHFVDAIFLDLGVGIMFLILVGFLCQYLLEKKLYLLIGVTLLFVVGTNGVHYMTKYKAQNPFSKFHFIQCGILFSDKLEIVDSIYKKANGRPFTFASVGTPFGVRTVWASVFEEYSRTHDAALPQWYGFHAAGYPGDFILTSTDHPKDIHFLIIESEINKLLPEWVVKDQIVKQDTATLRLEEYILHGFTIQVRAKINPLTQTVTQDL